MTRVDVHVAARGNGFMRDIATWITEAAAAAGWTSRLVDDELPAPDGALHLVVAPHEFFELFDAPTIDLQHAALSAVCIGTEQPGTSWFHLGLDACRRGLHSLDINPHGVAELLSNELPATHLRLGAVPSMVAEQARAPTADRPIDVLFMGGLDDRRGRALATLAPALVRRRSDLRLFRFDVPVSASTPGLVFGSDKYALLASARILVNLHRDRTHHFPPGAEPPAYFEWARMVEAMANRCAVVTEPAELYDPLVPGTHFVVAEIDELAEAIDALLDDDAARERVADAAHDAVTGPLALAPAVGAALEMLATDVLPRIPAHAATADPTRALWRLGASRQRPPKRLGPFRPYAAVHRQAKDLALADTAMLRRIDATTCLLRHGAPQHVERVETPAYATAAPDVTAVVTLYDYADVVGETLDSLARSEDIGVEIVVVDDHSTDDGRRVVREFMQARPEVPMLLLGKDANAGLAAARNEGFAAARGRYVMVIDADNHVYPTCLARLAETLDAHPDAAATYAILEDFGEQRNIRSALAWDVGRLCRANYIDAQAMWRVRDWVALGGYRNDDDLIYGWEDWDLWLRLAAAGGHALLHAEILGRYRVQTSSMISLTNLATDGAIEALRSRYPMLPWPDDAA